jgi:hypothetical protein
MVPGARPGQFPPSDNLLAALQEWGLLPIGCVEVLEERTG